MKEEISLETVQWCWCTLRRRQLPSSRLTALAWECDSYVRNITYIHNITPVFPKGAGRAHESRNITIEAILSNFRLDNIFMGSDSVFSTTYMCIYSASISLLKSILQPTVMISLRTHSAVTWNSSIPCSDPLRMICWRTVKRLVFFFFMWMDGF